MQPQEEEGIRQAASELISMFVIRKGVSLAAEVFSQERITWAMRKSKMVFNPNRHVTTYIFQKIIDRSFCLFFGPYGISKTTAFVLYNQLTYPLHLLQLVSPATFQELEKAKKVESLPRHIYLSLNPALLKYDSDAQSLSDKETTKAQMRNAIELQFPEFEEQFGKVSNPSITKSLNTIKWELMRIQKQARVTLDLTRRLHPMIDQINTYYSVVRKMAELFETAEKKKEKDILSKESAGPESQSRA